MEVDVLARAPTLLQLLPRLGKQRQELAFVVERGHDLVAPLVSQWAPPRESALTGEPAEMLISDALSVKSW